MPAWGLGCRESGRVLVLPRTYTESTQPVRQPLRRPARLRHIGRAALLHPDDRWSLPAARHTARRAATVSRIRLPVLPALYIVGAAVIMLVLLMYRPATTWPGFLIVLMGIPVFVLLRRAGRGKN